MFTQADLFEGWACYNAVAYWLQTKHKFHILELIISGFMDFWFYLYKKRHELWRHTKVP